MIAGVCKGASKPGNALCRLSSEPRWLQHERHEWLLSSTESQSLFSSAGHAGHEPHPVQPCHQVGLWQPVFMPFLGGTFKGQYYRKIVLRLQNVPLSSLPGHQLPDSVASRPSRESARSGRKFISVTNSFWHHFLFFRTSSSSVTKIPDTGGYLDPETGDWVSTNSVINSEEENSRHSHSSSRASKNTQVGSDFSVNSGDGTYLF